MYEAHKKLIIFVEIRGTKRYLMYNCILKANGSIENVHA